MPPGLYLWARVPSHLRRLRQELASGFHWEKPARVPEGFPLFLLKEGDFRSRAARASCYQETAADGAFCLILFGRLEAAIYKGGISGYAQLHWEAGFLGQWLYLEAEASGVAGTGIGCFFDSEPLAWFGLQGGRWQVIYHFSIGSALPDPRIMSWDPYLQS
ncbi:hypothetical protein MPNT_110069 [Candidatus Methylacidithermus pantelleriae]|uniref:Nitroreductase domain-containing protein n=1 Tax=Candidatus Methylacidithermus pantelleriae TaxID=2744239 RepID=A0A8J2BMF9_9BACT|nr:hypothetical protein MPNT_110069 [Candidatus Methylacidithermus pantelleriae]